MPRHHGDDAQNGSTALHEAVRLQDHGAINCLIEARASLEARDSVRASLRERRCDETAACVQAGVTPLWLASRSLSCASALLIAGADPSQLVVLPRRHCPPRGGLRLTRSVQNGQSTLAHFFSPASLPQGPLARVEDRLCFVDWRQQFLERMLERVPDGFVRLLPPPPPPPPPRDRSLPLRMMRTPPAQGADPHTLPCAQLRSRPADADVIWQRLWAGGEGMSAALMALLVKKGLPVNAPFVNGRLTALDAAVPARVDQLRAVRRVAQLLSLGAQCMTQEGSVRARAPAARHRMRWPLTAATGGAAAGGTGVPGGCRGRLCGRESPGRAARPRRSRLTRARRQAACRDVLKGTVAPARRQDHDSPLIRSFGAHPLCDVNALTHVRRKPALFRRGHDGCTGFPICAGGEAPARRVAARAVASHRLSEPRDGSRVAASLWPQ